MQPEDVWSTRLFMSVAPGAADITVIPLISWPVWMSTWTCVVWKQILLPSWCVSWLGLKTTMAFCWRIRRGVICICFCSIYQSLARACSWRMWQGVSPNKVPRDREGWSVTPAGQKGWGVLLPDGWTIKEKSADLTPMSSFPTQPPTVFFSPHALPCLILPSWSVQHKK